MSYLSPEQKATLLQLINTHELGGLDPGSIANKLNQPTRITTQVPKPFTMAGLLGLVSGESRRKVKLNTFMDSFIRAVDINDRIAVATYATIFKEDAEITEAEFNAIMAMIAETVGVEADGDPLFKTAFPNFSITITKQAIRILPSGETEKDENGQDGLFTESVTYHTCPPDLVIEAMS